MKDMAKQKESSRRSEKRAELEKITDMVHEWAVKYDEWYVDIKAYNHPNTNSAMANIDPDDPDHQYFDIYKKYETPGAATPRASR